MWERNIDHLPPMQAPTRGQTCIVGMCPNQGSNPQTGHVPWSKLNLQPSGEWDCYPTNWATKPGPSPFFFNVTYLLVVGREKHRFVVPLTRVFTGWLLHVPWPEIEPCTLGVSGGHSNQLSYPARALPVTVPLLSPTSPHSPLKYSYIWVIRT